MYSPCLPTIPLGRRVADPAPMSPPRPPWWSGLVEAGGPPITRRRGLLGRYLAAVGMLLGLTVALAPAPATERAGPRPAHRVEVIQVDGAGLNAVTRTAMRATAWTSALAVERQRDLLAPSPLASRVLGPLAARFSVWRDANRTHLATSSITAVTVLIFYGVMAKPTRRSWARMVLLLLVWSMLATYPQTVLHAASLPGQGTTRLMMALVGHTDQAGHADDADADARPVAVQQRLGDGFWTAFVTQPFSRVQTGSAVLAQAPPEQRTGLLGVLRERVEAIDRRVGGGAAFERALAAMVALASTVPFATAIAASSVAAWLAQTVLLLLCLTALAFAPLLLLDARARLLLVRCWLTPLLGALALTGVASAASFGILWLAVTLASAGEGVTRILSGSGFAAGCVLLTAWRLRRWARRLNGLPSASPTDTSSTPAGVSATAASGSESNVA